MKTKIFPIISILMLGPFLLSPASQHAFASAPARQTVVGKAPVQAAVSIDPQDLETFLDGLMPAEMEENHIPGAVVAVVQNGQLLLAKGYGYANLENQTPVVPERTLFRVASVSKLFIWTAVMQLVEQGEISLDVDVNEYLDFNIPVDFDKPITIRQLMSHTAGFEDKGVGMYTLRSEQMVPLEDFVKDNLPARIFPPEEIISYSNYGSALAGYIVERVSGLSFDEYVERHIFALLGMDCSSFRQPQPESLASDAATGYAYNGEQNVAGSFLFQRPYPEGAMSASATDMARFMIAHLQNGELDGQRILQEATAIQMHSHLQSPNPRLAGGMAYGFFENTINDQRVLSHGGNLFNFISTLHLIPDKGLGVFISTNGANGSAVTVPVMEAFFDYYFPVEESLEHQSVKGFAGRIAPYLGEYTPARSNFTTSERIYSLIARPTTSLDDDNTLVLSIPGHELRFVEVEPGLIQAEDDPSIQWVYFTGSNGRRYLTGTQGIYEPQTLVMTPWYGTRNLHMVLFLSGTVLFLAAMIAWPIGYLIGRRKKAATSDTVTRAARLARWAAVLFGLFWLASLLGIASIFADIVPGFGQPRIVFETPPVMNIVYAMAYVLGGLALAMSISAVLAWVRRYWSLGGRIFYSLLAFLGLLLIWSLVYWNLLF